MALKTNYVDDILNTNKNTKRRYNMIQNSDGTVSFEDVTDYKQVGDSFGSADVNSQNKEINKIGNTSISGIGDGTLTGAISGLNSNLVNLTKKLSWRGNWTQNMDVTPGNYNCGAYWVTSVTTDSRYVEGTHAFTDTYYYLFVFPNSDKVQFAINYRTGEIKSRCYVNDKWQFWSPNFIKTTDVVNIANGGTGATTAAAAMQKLAPNHFTSPAFVYTMGSNGYAGGSGYSSIAELKTAMDLSSNMNKKIATLLEGNTSTTKNVNYTATKRCKVYIEGFNTETFNSQTQIYVNGLRVARFIDYGQQKTYWSTLVELYAGDKITTINYEGAYIDNAFVYQ